MSPTTKPPQTTSQKQPSASGYHLQDRTHSRKQNQHPNPHQAQQLL